MNGALVVLTKTRELLENPNKWSPSGFFTCFRSGDLTGYGDSACLLGAIYLAADGDPEKLSEASFADLLSLAQPAVEHLFAVMPPVVGEQDDKGAGPLCSRLFLVSDDLYFYYGLVDGERYALQAHHRLLAYLDTAIERASMSL